MFPSKALEDHQESESIIIIILSPTALGIVFLQVASLWYHKIALKAVFYVVCALARFSAKGNVCFHSLHDDNKRCDDMREKIDDRQTRGFSDVKELKEKRDGDTSDVHFMKRNNTEYGCRRIILEHNNHQGLAPLLSRDKLTSCCTDKALGADLHQELELHRQYALPLCGDVGFEKPSHLVLDSIIPTTLAAPCLTSRVVVFSLREIALSKIEECTTERACGAIARSRDKTFEKRSKEQFASEDWDVGEGEEVDGTSSSSLSPEYHDLHCAQSTSSFSQASEEDELPTKSVPEVGVASNDSNNNSSSSSSSSPDNSRSCTSSSPENVSADDLNTSESGLGAVNHSSQPPQVNATVDRVHVGDRSSINMSSSPPMVCKQRQPTPEDFAGFLGKTEKVLRMDFVKMHKSLPLIPKDYTLNIFEDEELNKKKGCEEDGRQKKEESLVEFDLAETLYLPSRLAPRYPVCATVNMMRAVQGNTNHLQPQQQQQQSLPLRAIHGNYENELHRLASLAYLPDLGFNLFMIPVAAAGFYFPEGEEAERLRCAFCNVAESVHSFRDRRPMDVHRELSPSCPLVLGQTSSNVTIADHAHSSAMHFLLSHQSDIRNDAQQRTWQPSAGLVTPGEPGRSDVVSSGTTDLSVDGEASARQLPLPALPTAKGLAELQQTARPLSVAGSNSVSVIPATFEPLGKPFSASPASSTAGRVAGGQTVADHASAPRSFSSIQPQSSQPRQPVSSGRREHEPPASTTEPSSGPPSTERKVVTYEQLGIINQKPVRPDLAVAATRISTFTAGEWPHMRTHPPELMAEAGFYYTAHVDLVRCFYCKGGLKTWMETDNPWIEHARWFPKCPYVRLCKGPKFVEAVRILNDPDTVREISMDSIKSEIRRMEEEERRNVEQIQPQSPVVDSKPSLMLMTPKTDGAVASEVDMGAVGEEESFLETSGDDADSDRLEKLSTRLQSENEEMKGMTTCKICQQRQVNVLFLPCGHLIACAQCATALRTCAVCRQPVKGAVRVQSDSNDDDDEMEDQ